MRPRAAGPPDFHAGKIDCRSLALDRIALFLENSREGIDKSIYSGRFSQVNDGFVYQGAANAMTRPQLGRVQLKIMRVLWEKGRANAREITEALCREEPIAHSTVQTLLRMLEAKGSIDHEVVERTFIFYPRVEEDGVRRGAVRDLVERIFGGSAAGLVTHLLKNEAVSSKELEQIRKLIDERRLR